MSLFEKIQSWKTKQTFDQTARKGQSVRQEISSQLRVSSLCSDYENLFPQIRPLINEMKMVHPFGLGRNGARLPLNRTPELAALEYPNDDMGWDEFMDLVFATWLTESEALIWVHKSPRGKILGYTTLPVGSRRWVGGEERFNFITRSGEPVDIPRDEVMVLRFSRSPKNPDQGVSPANVAHFWAQIQDLLAQYQKAYLENGAVPASITFITAATEAQYNEKRRALEAGLAGAKNKNKTIYAWRNLLPDNTMGDEIEVKTIQGNNSTLAIREIMDIASDQLNKAVGVSNFILGDDSSAKYDNAELSAQQFMLHRVYPALVSFWNQFQHELDRIVGGLGYSINFDLEIPELTEQMKVKAETKRTQAETSRVKADIENEKVRLELEEKRAEKERQKIQAETDKITMETLTSLIVAGASPEAATTAMQLGTEWLQVAQDIQGTGMFSSQTTMISQNPKESEEISAHNSNETEYHSDHCTHCRHTHDATEPEFSPDKVIERGIYDELIALLEAIINRELDGIEAMPQPEIDELIIRIEDKLIAVAGKGAIESLEQTTKSINQLPTAAIVGIINGQRPSSHKQIINALNEEKTAITSPSANTAETKINVDRLVRAKMDTRTSEIVQKYSGEAAAKIRQTLKQLQTENLTKSEIKKQLIDTLPKGRAEMIARNEVINAYRLGELECQKAIADKYNLKIKKTWHAHPGECPICAAMDGTTVSLSEPFPAEQVEKDGVTYAWEHSTYNDGGETPNAHVDCRCYFTFEVVP